MIVHRGASEACPHVSSSSTNTESFVLFCGETFPPRTSLSATATSYLIWFTFLHEVLREKNLSNN